MTPHPDTTPVVTADGTLLLATDYGPRTAAHTLLLLHGLCLDQTSWKAPITLLHNRFGDHLRIITYDHRGHGRSGRAPTRTYHVEQLADDIGDVLGSLNITGPLTVAGHSLGGMAALTYCARPAQRRPVQPHGLASSPLPQDDSPNTAWAGCWPPPPLRRCPCWPPTPRPRPSTTSYTP